MPAIITHDFFGRDVYDRQFNFIGGSRDEADAFLLGNQGPNPLFFLSLSPRYHDYARTGSLLHDRKPTEQLNAFKQSLSVLSDNDRRIGRAYLMGYVCHYSLDVAVHPFVYSQQYAICDAGEPGLDRDSGHEVHATIESELDELVLFAKREETVATYEPAKRILKASDETLGVISKMYAYVLLSVYGMVIPEDLYAVAVKCYRMAQQAVYSPKGIKRSLVGAVERLGRTHSLVQALTPQPVERADSDFDNRQHDSWTDPFTFAKSTSSFWNLYDAALLDAYERTIAIDRRTFGLEDFRAITRDRDFSGAPVVAVVTSVVDASEAPSA